jgi:hypothetical protein
MIAERVSGFKFKISWESEAGILNRHPAVRYKMNNAGESAWQQRSLHIFRRVFIHLLDCHEQ